jgi:hypothetical protein
VGVVSTPAQFFPIPDGTLRIAYRQLDNGQLADWVHQVQLSCHQGDCLLTTLTLNQCASLPSGERVSYPKVESSSTHMGDLAVKMVAANTVEAVERQGDATLRYRFIFAEPRRLSGAAGSAFGDVLDFSGSVFTDTPRPSDRQAWEMAPVVGHLVPMEAQCKLMLDGLPRRR